MNEANARAQEERLALFRAPREQLLEEIARLSHRPVAGAMRQWDSDLLVPYILRLRERRKALQGITIEQALRLVEAAVEHGKDLTIERFDEAPGLSSMLE